MTQPDDTQLRVRADLLLEVDGVEASVVGDGDRLTVSTTDAAGLLTHAMAALSAVPVASGSQQLRRAAQQIGQKLVDSGVSVHVVDRRGTLFEIGRDCHSTAGRVLLGTEHARLGAPRAVLTALGGYARNSPTIRTRFVSGVGGLVIAGLVIATAKRRR